MRIPLRMNRGAIRVIGATLWSYSRGVSIAKREVWDGYPKGYMQEHFQYTQVKSSNTLWLPQKVRRCV